jgi:hypothetical protein
MKNIERFNLCTAYLFGKLYEEFPVHCKVIPTDVVRALKLPPPEKLAKNHDAEATEANLVAHTLLWLVETGYVIKRVRSATRTRYVLAPKALEALNAPLNPLKGNKNAGDKKSIGERLAEVATEAGKDVAKETWKQSVTQLVGQVIGHAAKVFSGS